jgi:polar amino acid transport system ATP-binding protein
MTGMVEVRKIHKSFHGTPVLKGVDLSVAAGSVTCIIGPSGSGKSTLLRCLNGLEIYDSGSVEVAGHKLTTDPAALRELRKDVGIVFQSFNLFPHLSVAENVMLAPRLVHKTDKAAATALAEEMLARVGLSDKMHARPDQLSGGQQQRVAIARSLAMKPKVMLFDEVTSALDPELTAEVLVVLERLAADGMTMLLVTHEMGFARGVATRSVFMLDGRIHESGPPAEMFANPQTREFQQFIGQNLK